MPSLGYGELIGGLGLLGGLAGLLLLLTVTAGLVLLFVLRRLRSPSKRDPGRSAASSSLEVLETRYARGEIGRDEYMKIRQDLT